MKCKLFLLAIMLQTAYAASSQDIGFSQFYDQPLLRNPALAGIFTGDIRFTASYRNQWESVTVPYRTFGLSSEVKLPVQIRGYDCSLTLGLQLSRDVAGTSEFSTTQAMPAANLSMPIGEKSFVSAGFMGGLMQQRFDPTKLTLNDQFLSGANGSFTILPSSGQTFNTTDINYFDMAAGVSSNGTLANGTDYFIGLGVFHLNTPKLKFFEGDERAVKQKFTANVGLDIPVADYNDFILYGDYFRQAKVNTIQAGMMYRYALSVSDRDEVSTSITGGILYRLDDAIIPVIELHISRFTIGTSYDVNISKLAVASQYRGGLEVTLSYNDLFGYNKAEGHQNLCLRFGGHMPGGRYLGY